MYQVLVRVISDTDGPDASGRMVPMAANTDQIVNLLDINYFRDHPDCFIVTDTDPGSLAFRWDAAAGAYVAVGATSLLSVTTIRFASNTAGLATSSDLAFDTVLRDDLGLATGMTAGRIRIPSNCTQFRISYSVGAVPVAGGSYRRLQVGIYTANDALGGIATVNSLITLGIRSSVREVPSAGMITAAQQNDLALSTHLIDCSTLPTPLSTNAAYADNQYVKLTLTHDIGSALQVIGSGSSFTLECYTPA